MEENVCFLCSAPASNRCNHCNLVSYCSESHRVVHRPGKTCFPFCIKQSPDKGRYMVAVRDIEALETILEERAVACGPKLQHSAVCVECFRDVDMSQCDQCPRCHLPFCSTKCLHSGQLHDGWECQIFSRCDLDHGGGCALALASLTPLRLLRLRSEDQPLYNRVNLLIDNIQEIRESSDYKLQEECVDFLTNKCGITEFNANDIHRALGIFKSNSCSISGFRARALFPTFSLINHSCLRNARHLINSEQRLMQIVAQADIKAGQEINVRYTCDVLETWTERRDSINSTWHFQCGCVRCSDSTEMGTHASSVLCHQCDDKGALLLTRDNQQWQCSACGQLYSHKHVDTVVGKLKLSLDRIPSDNVTKHEAWLKVATRILHPNHVLIVNVKQRLLHLYGSCLDQTSVNRKLELSEHVMSVMDKLDPGITAWRAKILYDITRFKLVSSLQEVQSRKMRPEEVVRKLSECVLSLEEAVSGLTGDKFGGPKTGTLKHRIESLSRAKLLGDGYKMLLTTCLKLPFIK